MTDHWRNPNSHRTASMRSLWLAVYTEGSDVQKACGELDPEDAFLCCRAPHPLNTRHIALGGQGLVICAWPGTHKPTLADMEATP